MTTELQDPPKPDRSRAKLGEELPVFCERCGYSLNALPMTRCEHCTILQFHCPECGHHQPINTLRPAAQTILGRIRGGWLVLVVLFKLNLIGWGLILWAAMGNEFSYRYFSTITSYNAQGQPMYSGGLRPEPLQWETAVAFTLLGLVTGMIWRMALLRWRRGWAIGLVMGAMVMGAIVFGERSWHFGRMQNLPSAYTPDFLTEMAIAYAAILFGAFIAWPIWKLLVRAFLPTRTATALLNWQLSLSHEASELARIDERQSHA